MYSSVSIEIYKFPNFKRRSPIWSTALAAISYCSLAITAILLVERRGLALELETKTKKEILLNHLRALVHISLGSLGRLQPFSAQRPTSPRSVSNGKDKQCLN